jgi:hypothetical protein
MFAAMKRLIIVAMLCSAHAAAANGQTTDCSPSMAELKKTAIAAKAANPGDDFAVIKAMDKAAGIDTGYATQHPAISLSKIERLSAYLTLPFLSYRLAVSEALRKRESIEGVQLPAGVIVSVSPSTLDAPDIIKVVVTRNGVDVQPVASTLKPTELTTRMGAKVVLHAGELLFSCGTPR